MNQQSININGLDLILQTGVLAKQSTASVKVTYGKNVLLATLVATENKQPGDFFPLRVDYQEMSYAAGKFPGGYLKREGMPGQREILISRLIDRPIRPLFPKGFVDEVQIIVKVMSYDSEHDCEWLAMVAASAAVSAAKLPISSTLGAVRVGYINGEYLLNPSTATMGDSELDLIVAGTDSSVMMVESQAKGLSEDVMLGAVEFGHKSMQPIIEVINQLADNNTEQYSYTPFSYTDSLLNDISSKYEQRLSDAFLIKDKMQRYSEISVIKSDLHADYKQELEGSELSAIELDMALGELKSSIVRKRILAGEPRIDGRAIDKVRNISIDLDLLPSAHGSAVFTRGETQVLSAITLGTEKDAKYQDSPVTEAIDRFILDYNFPPYSVGEVGMVGRPKRREIGHGKLAHRALFDVIPTQSDFPYVIRAVNEVLESNGSSSMATVCATSLALMKSGVPIKEQVAGVAMGLIKEDEQFKVLTDILGDEDHLGDMDFKVAGTQYGVNALQMDIKITGITIEIMKQALSQARDARLHILSEMNKVISAPSKELASTAPRLENLQIKQDKVGEVIGKGGSTIKSIIEKTGANVEISQEGLVSISADNKESVERALQMVKDIVAEAELGKVYMGEVANITNFGAFINILPGINGLLHISNIVGGDKSKSVSDVISIGDKVEVKVSNIDKAGRIKLEMTEQGPLNEPVFVDLKNA